MEERALRLELRLDTDPLLVSPARRFVEEVLEKVVTDADLVSRVAMTAHELLENAAKYARNTKAELSVTMQPLADGAREIVLKLSNATSPHHVDRLKQMFARLDGCGDPLTFYLNLMRQNAHEVSQSGLGLARIRAEAEMSLALAVNGEVATIVARTIVPPGALS
jgi:hypothetical protein